MILSGNIEFSRARFIERLNRFVAQVSLDGRLCSVHVPNTGRLAELLLPGAEVVLVPAPGKYPYSIRYVIYKDRPVLIDSIMSNSIFHECLQLRRIPGFEEYRVIKREPPVGRHRFDFLVAGPEKDCFVEIKSCTLAWNSIASFPDAVSARAAEHVRILAETGKGILVFLLMHEGVNLFVPNYHTDFTFYETLRSYGAAIDVRAYSACYDQDFRIEGFDRVRIEMPEVRPRGVYVMVLSNSEDRELTIGGLGTIFFKNGYYLYVGSGMNNLFARIEYHRRKKKKQHWHIDYLSDSFAITAVLPIVTEERMECSLAGAVASLGYRCVTGFGSSDCSCPGHLYYAESNPLHSERFIAMIYDYRFGQFPLQ